MGPWPSVFDLARSGAHPCSDLALSSPTGGPAALFPTQSHPADFSRRPGVCPRCGPSLLAASLALQLPPLPGGSSTGGRSPCSLPPPDSGATRGGAAALFSLAAGCPSPLRGGDPPGRSPSPLGSNLPWAAPVAPRVWWPRCRTPHWLPSSCPGRFAPLLPGAIWRLIGQKSSRP